MGCSMPWSDVEERAGVGIGGWEETGWDEKRRDDRRPGMRATGARVATSAASKQCAMSFT